MGRTTKQLSGAGKDKFLRGAIAGENSIAPDVARRLGDAMCSGIADIRVRREAWQPGAGTAGSSEDDASSAARPAAHATAATTTAAAATFDPFVFSALAVLTKQGAPALVDKLRSIPLTADLHALAKAQHLAVDAALTDLPALRMAILSATEQRLAERRAAAS